MPAAPCPMPTHIVTMPYLSLLRLSACTTVAERIAPVAPSGCPSAMAPPIGLTFDASSSSVFITASVQAGFVEIMVEDDGKGIPEADRIRIFDRGVRLDSGKPGTGLGLAIVRDVAEIYDGTVSLEESEDLGGLLVRLRLPAAS